MEISRDEWDFATRVDLLLSERAAVLARIPELYFIGSSGVRTDRLGKLTVRVDFRKRWVNAYGRPVMRRVSVRISEIRGGFSFTRFDGGTATFKASGRTFGAMSVYARARLL